LRLFMELAADGACATRDDCGLPGLGIRFVLVL
jgi:hypothetical protein